MILGASGMSVRHLARMGTMLKTDVVIKMTPDEHRLLVRAMEAYRDLLTERIKGADPREAQAARTEAVKAGDVLRGL